MNKIYKSLLAAALVLPSAALTGCIEEVFPTSGMVSQEQINEISTTATAYCNGMPSYMNTVFVVPGERHWDFGYPSMMFIRDTMTGDMPVVSSGYNWFSRWSENIMQGGGFIFGQTIWTYYWKQVQAANLTLSALPEEPEDPKEKAQRGYAYGYRALAYLDLARMYEYLPTTGTSPIDKESNVDVTGLTVPIVTQDIDEELARSNPRVPHDKMVEFILSDLDEAEKLIDAQKRTSKTFPDLACIYGLKARLYMWDENYSKAAEYARKAITTSGATPLTPEEWLDTENGFNQLSSHAWLWGTQYVQEDDAVLTGIINWTSWASNEFVNGYSAAGPYVMIDAALYNSISNDDIRKLAFVAPKGSPLAGQERWLDKDNMISPVDGSKIDLPAYASLKIRPGHGDMVDPSVGCVVGVPLMRIEEMIFIEAEAIAHSNPGEGKRLITEFLTKYRCESYEMLGSNSEQVVDEIFQQKRMEFFEEGIMFFDYKRLDKGVTRRYSGTNFYDMTQFNTEGRPAWMNLVAVDFEPENNPAFINNPDPSGCYEDQLTTDED